MTRTVVRAAAVGAALILGAALPARATLDMQKQAKAAGVTVANCLHCHGEKMPKKGASTLNDAGRWLQAEKDKRKAKAADGGWLKEYRPKT